MTSVLSDRIARLVDLAKSDDRVTQVLIPVLVAAVVFQLLSALVTRACRSTFKGADLTIADYRIVGLIHHTLQVPLALWVLRDPRMWQDRLFSHTPTSTLMLIISAGYFSHDIVHALRHVHVQGWSYVIHGVGCASVYLYGLLHQPTMLHFYGAGFLLWEVSSFFVHFRWFLFKAGAAKKLQLLNGLALLLSFFGARMVWGFYLSYMAWQDILACHDATCSPAFKATLLSCNVVLNALNTYWFWLILQKAAGALSGRKEDSVGKRD